MDFLEVLCDPYHFTDDDEATEPNEVMWQRFKERQGAAQWRHLQAKQMSSNSIF